MFSNFSLATTLLALSGAGAATPAIRSGTITTTTTSISTTVTNDTANATVPGTVTVLGNVPFPGATVPLNVTVPSNMTADNSTVPGNNSLFNSTVTSYDNASQNQQTSGYKVVGYYSSWTIYSDETFKPMDIQASVLTHAIYAFAGIHRENGSAYLVDPWADVQKGYPGDVDTTNSSILMGGMNQLFLHKKRNRQLKTLLSFGGYDMADNVSVALSTPNGRKAFADSSVAMMLNLGFDGIDLDWEYPNNTAMCHNLVDTIRQVRENMDAATVKLDNKPHFLLTLAVPAGAVAAKYIDVPSLNPYIDFLNVMAYDYTGSWSNLTGHHANVFSSTIDSKTTPYNTDAGLKWYLDQGLPPWKYVLGAPLYARVFDQTDGLGESFNKSNSTGPGAVYKKIALDNVQYDMGALASYVYDNITRQFLSFDDSHIAWMKVQYLQANRLAGMMFWSIESDRALNDANSIIKTVTDLLYGPFQLFKEKSENNLNYPDSQFVNLRR